MALQIFIKNFDDMNDRTGFDVIIIGGSYAGLSAAMSLGRSLKNVLIIDSGNPCNKKTPHSHNFITQDGETPQAISNKAKQQVLAYPTIKFIEDEAIEAQKTEKKFIIKTKNEKLFETEKLIFATGISDQLPAIPGFAESWAKTVIHCPYCHGYEFRDEPTAILGNGERAIHLASLVNNLTKKLKIFTNGKPDFTQEQQMKLKNHSIEIIEKKVNSIRQTNGQIEQVRFEDGSNETLRAMYAIVPFVQHTAIPEKLGCAMTTMGHIEVDAMGKTSIAGIYACGDCASPMRSVANAVSTGNFIGAVVNSEITQEGF